MHNNTQQHTTQMATVQTILMCGRHNDVWSTQECKLFDVWSTQECKLFDVWSTQECKLFDVWSTQECKLFDVWSTQELQTIWCCVDTRVQTIWCCVDSKSAWRLCGLSPTHMATLEYSRMLQELSYDKRNGGPCNDCHYLLVLCNLRTMICFCVVVWSSMNKDWWCTWQTGIIRLDYNVCI